MNNKDAQMTNTIEQQAKIQDDLAAASKDTNSGSRKRNRETKNLNISSFSCRHPEWSYIHLKHITATAQSTSTDETSVSLFIDAALSQFLGLHGRAIPIDFLKISNNDIWIRIPNQDQQAFIGALSTWVGRSGDALRVVGTSSWDANAFGRDAGQDLFTK